MRVLVNQCVQVACQSVTVDVSLINQDQRMVDVVELLDNAFFEILEYIQRLCTLFNGLVLLWR